MSDKQIKTTQEPQPDRLKQLKSEITRQRKYCRLMGIQNQSGAECARGSGYTEKNAWVRSSTLLRSPNIRLLIEKHSELNQFLHGRDAAWYRNELQTLLEQAKIKADVGAGNSVLRTMLELDNLLSTGKGRGNTSVQIVINTGLSSAVPSVIEGEVISQDTR